MAVQRLLSEPIKLPYICCNSFLIFYHRARLSDFPRRLLVCFILTPVWDSSALWADIFITYFSLTSYVFTLPDKNVYILQCPKKACVFLQPPWQSLLARNILSRGDLYCGDSGFLQEDYILLSINRYVFVFHTY